MGGADAISGPTAQLRNTWEATAFQLERLQAAEECVEAEEALQTTRTAPVWKLPFKPTWTSPEKMASTNKVRWLGMAHGSRACPCCLALFPSRQARLMMPSWAPVQHVAGNSGLGWAQTSDSYVSLYLQVQVAILREEGSNGDREMAAAVHAVSAGPQER